MAPHIFGCSQSHFHSNRQADKPRFASDSQFEDVLPPAFRYTDRRGEIALTFDDGPNPDVTPHVLDLLDHYSIHATFFLIGRFVRVCENLVREIAVRGHSVGNHTDSHPGLTLISQAQVSEELSRCQHSIATVTGTAPMWMRPPFGLYGPQLRGLVWGVGLRRVAMWSIICGDWRHQPTDALIQSLGNVGKSAGGGDIVVLHDGDHRTLRGDRWHILDVLEYWIPRWCDVGYEFIVLDQVGKTSSI